MEVFNQIEPIQEYLQTQRFKHRSIGLVPTMGALHKGHVSLLNACKRDNDISVCSIFVNPTQFNNQEDLAAYPRQWEQDLAILEQEGCDAVFLPEENEMYRDNPRIRLNFGELEEVMEGKFRPGHFNGVGLVVSKLFHILSPDRAYFGQKDLQQFAIIRQLVTDMSFQVDLMCEPIIREEDGLAMSSRNTRLNPQERQTATALYAALKRGASAVLEGKNLDEIRRDNMQWLEDHGIVPEYFEIVDAETLTPLMNHFERKSVALCVAGNVGPVRLIDNILIEKE
ncbi:pantoate--beta-alanine ligase [Fulvivirga sedimenti]|uniref:Pantothenate synthetase n=1 Tax=Fulvivirga sedimenti TaxID=2879465 RepID=A0A9X1HPG9_9BACT|nr:pantoate--beta-alanine ligase [Fulvivirga sedimenti]MCA6074382.1 pantoate--beta-alanine ligase [Fulvivirga sedimenti]